MCYYNFSVGLSTKIIQSFPSPTMAELLSRSASPKAQITTFPTTNRITTPTKPTKTIPMTKATRVVVQVSQNATAPLCTTDDNSMKTNATTPSSTRNQVLTRSTVGEHLHLVHTLPEMHLFEHNTVIESWVIVTIAAFVFLLLIVIVFLSYKHRQTLLTFCFSSCRMIRRKRKKIKTSRL